LRRNQLITLVQAAHKGAQTISYAK